MTKNLAASSNGESSFGTEATALVAAVLAYAARPEPRIVKSDTNGQIYGLLRDGDGSDVLKTFPELLAAPLRIRQDVKVTTPVALIDYVALFGSPDHTLIFAHQDTLTLQAAIDYHTAEGAQFVEHKATLKLQPTPPWKDWTGVSGKAMDQGAFARFLEDHIPDIKLPDAGLLVEAAQNFQATIGVTAKNIKRIDNGAVTVVWAEAVEDVSPIKLPTKLELELQPFAGAKVYAVEAQVRYSIKAGQLLLWFDLMRPDRVIEAAFADVVTTVTAGTRDTARAVVLGSL